MKSPVKSIAITRAEGLIDLCGKTYTFKAFGDANCHIAKFLSTYPDMGYDKHDIKIEWENGMVYKFRLDAYGLKNEYYKGNTIDGHILSACRYYCDSSKNIEVESRDYFNRLVEYCEI